MKRSILILVAVILINSCAYEWLPYYVTFEEAIEFITVDYGEPHIIRDTAFYDDGTVRNRVVYWEIDPPELVGYSEYNRPIYVSAINMEIWNQPYSDRSIVLKYRQYGWEVLRWNKGNFLPAE